ncbi:MAG TPA: alpha/beta hydrolase [Micromonosporaceae bacterium]
MPRHGGIAPHQLRTTDGVRLDVCHQTAADGSRDLGIVLAHGFTGSWRGAPQSRIAALLATSAGVVSFDFRGHGRSGGHSTVGDREILDVAAAVAWARTLGYRQVATLGFSMGASVVIRHAGQLAGPDAVAAVSGPGRWYFRGTPPMRRVHWIVERPAGRLVSRLALGTRISSGRWDPVPEQPTVAVARISPTPLLIVHGDRDRYFPVGHAHALYEAARQPKELWIVPGFGHAESAADPTLVSRIAAWLRTAARGVDPGPAAAARQ